MRFIPSTAGLARGIARQRLHLEKNSPALLFGAGVVGMIGSTVLACRATLKLEDILTRTEAGLKVAKELEHPDYSETDRRRDIAIIYGRSAGTITKLYAPAIGLGIVSIAALTKSHNTLTRRNAALSAAYIAIERGFSEYRSRVVAKYGEEEDQAFRYGTREVEIVNDKGAVKKVTRVGTDTPSVYAKFFDPSSPSWQEQPEYNLLFLRCQQNYANDMLRSRGHVFLNEVYDMLGIPRTKAGQVVGWALTSENTDKYVDFGMYNKDSESVREFVNGREGAILLDFNVDGLIYDLIEDKRPVQWRS